MPYVSELQRQPSTAWLLMLALTVMVWSRTAAAQSVDPNHPTPLGPGVNKGNIDSNVKGHFYTFVAGPGHLDVDIAFKEMGLFGQPFRQSLNFDFYREDRTLSSHNSLVSQGVIARGHTGGDLVAKQRFILVISTQRSAIKVGGYYEISIRGAEFEGPTVGANVVPQGSEPLVRPAR